MARRTDPDADMKAMGKANEGGNALRKATSGAVSTKPHSVGDEDKAARKKREPESEHIEVRKLEKGYLISHSKHYKGKPGEYREPERSERYSEHHPLKMLEDKKGEASALTKNERAPAKLPGEEPANAVRRATDTGGPSKAPRFKAGERVRTAQATKGEKVKHETTSKRAGEPGARVVKGESKVKSMAEWVKHREKTARRR